MKKGDLLRVTITDVSNEGNGVARATPDSDSHNRVIFVKNATMKCFVKLQNLKRIMPSLKLEILFHFPHIGSLRRRSVLILWTDVEAAI